MASESRIIDSDLANSVMGNVLRQEPYRFEFFQAVRLLEAIFPAAGRVGTFLQPANEVVRLGAHPSPAFPASQIQVLEWDDTTPLTMYVNFMGLMGPLGVLPTPYNSLILERVRAGDSTLREFFDIFNHRILSLFYQAWSKYQLDVASTSGHPQPLLREIASLIGLGTPGLQERHVVSDAELVYYSGLLSQLPRSATALRQILGDYFDVPVEIEQFAGSWYSLDADTQCTFSGEMRESEMLGSGVVLGDAVWNQEYKVTIVLGPLTLERYKDFLPEGSCWESLRAWTGFFSNQELNFEVKLVLERESVPACELGSDGDSAPRLGWISWVKSSPFQQDARDTVLILENA
jgi:type VI secretion system protein ImpH